MRVRIGSLVAASAVLAGTLVSGSSVAAVAAAPSLAPAGVCSGGLKYDITSNKLLHISVGKTFKKGPGGTLTGKVTKKEMIRSRVPVTGGASAAGVIAQAKREVKDTLRKEVPTSVGSKFTRKVAKKKYGNMRYGSWGQQVKWRYYQETPDCKRTTRATGTANIVSTLRGWRYWETAS
ncbi:hypothetical protein [Streptomyces sp. cmx-18-6]|uniref:hypothetical protein n=1 Tax=Streptomyces sp. cmx-18-6 TaxID=2790930 RepID=UPI00397EE207